MELVKVRAANAIPFAYGQVSMGEKRIHLAYDIENFDRDKLWDQIKRCVDMLHWSPADCVEIVQISAGKITNMFRRGHETWNRPFDAAMQSGGVIEIRFLGDVSQDPVNCLKVRQVHVELDDDQKYSFGRKYEGRITCEFTHYKYYYEKFVLLHMDFLSQKDLFPLVDTVKRDDCKEVVVVRPLMGGGMWPETIWQYGQALKLKRAVSIAPDDALEIRLVNVRPVAEPAAVNIPVDDDNVAKQDNDDMECVICLDNRRDVVFKPCNHCCVCHRCYVTMPTQECPCCMQQISSHHTLTEWKPDKPNDKIIFSTAGMDDVYGLLTCLERHF